MAYEYTPKRNRPTNDWFARAEFAIMGIRLEYKKILDELENLTAGIQRAVDVIARVIPELKQSDGLWYYRKFKSNEYDTLSKTVPGFDSKFGGHRIYLDVRIEYLDKEGYECDPDEFSNVDCGRIVIRTYLDSMAEDIDIMDIYIYYDADEKQYWMSIDTDDWDPTVENYNWEDCWAEEGEVPATFKQEDIDLLILLKSELTKFVDGDIDITDDTKLCELGFHIKVFHMLEGICSRYQSYTVGTLKKFSMKEISSIKGMGPFYLKNFVDIIERFGIELRTDDE